MTKNNTNKDEAVQKTAPKKKVVETTYNTKSVTIGLLLFVGVLSIGYMTTMVVAGTDGWISKVLTIPGALIAVILTLKQFCK